jgi:hypothetical protein
MALYANYIPNPTFELGGSSWFTYNSGSAIRSSSNASSGSYSLKVSQNQSQNFFGGIQITVPITPGGLSYTASLNVTGATEIHGAAYSAGTKVGVWDLLPGDPVTSKVLLKTQTFSRTTSGRVAVRDCVPRATADRIVLTIETASIYFQAQTSTQESTGVVWWSTGSPNPNGSGGITNPSGTAISTSQANAYTAAGWTLTNASNFTYHNTIGIDTWIPSRTGTFKRTVVTPEVNGGESTIYIDAVQLEQGTVETSYVDGTTPGYVWSGTPHDSPTLNVVFLEAGGTATLSGPDVEIIRLKFMQSAGTSTLSGHALEMLAIGTVTASGGLTSTGTADLWLFGKAAASGSGSVIGSAILYAIVPLEAHGTAMGGAGGADVPKATIRLAWDMWSNGTPSTLSGDVDVTFPQPISADGILTMDGTAHAEIGFQLIASGMMELLGQAQIDDATPAGAFGDFAIYGALTTDTDPLMLGIGGSNAGTNSGANGAEWVRIHGEFIAPADQPASGGKYAWRRAAYAAVGFTFANVGANLWQELSCIQLEPSSADKSPGPRTYKTAKMVEPMVWADRINYAVGDWWTFFGSTNISVANGSASPIAHDPNPIRTLTWTTSGYTGFFGSNIISPPPDSYTVASFYVRGTLPTIESRILNNSGLGTIATSGVIEIDPVEWTRVIIYFKSAEVEQIFCIADPDRTLTYPHHIEIAGTQVERGTNVGEYMNFIVGTTDYFYRNNLTDPKKGIFLYNNIGERIPLLTAALEEHAPLSVLVGEPEFGLIPTLD